MCWRTLRWLWLLLWRRRTIVAEAWGALWRRRGRWRGLSVGSPWAPTWWLLALALRGALLGTTRSTRTSLLVGRPLGLPSWLEVRSLHRLLLWRAHSWVAWLLRRSLAHMKWVSSIRVLTGLSRPNHHLGEAHLLLGVPLHGLHMGVLHPLLLSIYQLLLRRCRMGRSWIELVMPTRGEWGSSSLHDIVWCRSAMLVWLRLIGRMASASWQQVILHRDWGRHVATLRHMVSVDCLLLLRLLVHPGMHLVLLGTTTCIGRPLTKVLRRTGTSLLSRGVGGEPCSWIGGCRISPRTLGWALVGGISPRHDAADWRQRPFSFLNHPLPDPCPQRSQATLTSSGRP